MSQESNDPTTTRSEPAQTGAPFQFTLKGLLLFVTLMSVLCGLGVVITKPAREAANTASCIGSRMGMIAGVIGNYEAEHGHFPPASVADKSGKPMHSWRVLILPYLGYEGLYKRYNLSEPWNGPNNRRLAKEMPWEYRCPCSHPRDPLTTSYVAVIGDETLWPSNGTVRRKEITDGGVNTLMLVEVADSDIHWMEPRDMTLAEAIAGVNVDKRHGISSNHPGGSHCKDVYGLHVFLPDDTPAEVIRALLTIDGGEPLRRDVERETWTLRTP